MDLETISEEKYNGSEKEEALKLKYTKHQSTEIAEFEKDILLRHERNL